MTFVIGMLVGGTLVLITLFIAEHFVSPWK